MILIADVFPELPTAKYVVRYLSQNPEFRTLFNSQHGKRSQILLKSEQRHFYQLFPSLWWKLCWKISLLLMSEILALFGNTVTAHDNYSVRNSETLQQPIQTQLF